MAEKSNHDTVFELVSVPLWATEETTLPCYSTHPRRCVSPQGKCLLQGLIEQPSDGRGWGVDPQCPPQPSQCRQIEAVAIDTRGMVHD